MAGDERGSERMTKGMSFRGLFPLRIILDHSDGVNTVLD